MVSDNCITATTNRSRTKGLFGKRRRREHERVMGRGDIDTPAGMGSGSGWVDGAIINTSSELLLSRRINLFV